MFEQNFKFTIAKYGHTYTTLGMLQFSRNIGLEFEALGALWYTMHPQRNLHNAPEWKCFGQLPDHRQQQ
jgi:hypothetical protein